MIKIPSGLTLMPFQVQGAEFLISKTRALIASEPGLGKTVQLIAAVNTVLEKGKVCVLCPKSMILTWRREIDKWSMPGIEWHVTNYDQLLFKGFDKIAVKRDILICDESHECIKNPDTQRCEALLQVIPLYERLYLSTATPASKSGFDYYMTLKLLLPLMMQKVGEWDFKKEFCKVIPDAFSPCGYKFDGFKNEDTLRQIFRKCAIKHRKNIVAKELPSLTVSYVPLETDIVWNDELNPYILKAIEEGKDIGQGYQDALQRVAGAKMNAIADWCKSFPLNENLVVFAWHKSIVSLLMEKLSFRGEVQKITGEVSNVEVRQNIIDRFQKKELTTLVLNMQSGGVGITLTAASTALYVQPPMSYIHLEQSQNRVHRIGSERPVHIVRFVAVDTVEEQMYRVLDYRAESIRKVGV